ncbi:hypothetical protein J8J40_29585, partial [Mycobacterium tuberculosis]|nr:hypothetical protein [Mycobacterium tuberculosis]
DISVKDPEGKLRSFGRGGLGAVMGSKHVKFIAVNPEGGAPVKLADSAAFRAANMVFTKTLQDHPVSGKGLHTYGTAVLVNILNEVSG